MSKKSLFIVLILGAVTLAGCSYNTSAQPSGTEQNTITTDEARQNTITTTTDKKEENYTLTQAEIDGIMQMREEEKLARDVYLYLYQKWQLPIFNNIAASEQQHMDSVEGLINLYNLDDPIKQDQPGIFSNEEIANLYNQLTSQGDVSINKALAAGAMIEEMDIKDLTTLLAQTDNQNIITVYENLMRGSRNHLRAFIRNMDMQGEEYTPQFLSPADFNKIIKTDIEKGPHK